MGNAGYPDDDGSRTPSGQHDEGRQRVSIYPVENIMTPTTVADMAGNRDSKNVRTDSAGDQTVPNCGWKVDGNSNSHGQYNPAAYPASSGTNGLG